MKTVSLILFAKTLLYICGFSKRGNMLLYCRFNTLLSGHLKFHVLQ